MRLSEPISIPNPRLRLRFSFHQTANQHPNRFSDRRMLNRTFHEDAIIVEWSQLLTANWFTIMSEPFNTYNIKINYQSLIPVQVQWETSCKLRYHDSSNVVLSWLKTLFQQLLWHIGRQPFSMKHVIRKVQHFENSVPLDWEGMQWWDCEKEVFRQAVNSKTEHSSHFDTQSVLIIHFYKCSHKW
jgi:hypothetical protein